jgi:hypothetical protein
MAHRHYGLRRTNPRDTYTPARGAAWSGRAFIATILVIMIALCILLYGVSKTITDAGNTTTSVPRTTGEGTAR